jgi:hypothetical protein
MRKLTTKPVRKIRAAGISDVRFRDCGGVVEQGHGTITNDSPCYEEFARLLGLVPSEIGQRIAALEVAHKDALARKKELIETAGPLLWGELHRWARTADLATAGKWLADFAMRVPCGECRRHWREMMKRTPPDVSSREALFAWSVERHSEVSDRLGKPTMTVEDAARLYPLNPRPTSS